MHLWTSVAHYIHACTHTCTNCIYIQYVRTHTYTYKITYDNTACTYTYVHTHYTTTHAKHTHTLTAVTVSPAWVEPIPVVRTLLGIKWAAYFKNWDFPVPGSPTNSMWDSPLVRVPDSSTLCTQHIQPRSAGCTVPMRGEERERVTNYVQVTKLPTDRVQEQ